MVGVCEVEGRGKEGALRRKKGRDLGFGQHIPINPY